MTEPNYNELFTCHDCKRTLEKNEEFMEYPAKDGNGIRFIKCKDCHQLKKELTDYQDCEVYSRVVGYIRPVKQWNPGKKTEYGDRITFKVENICDKNC